MPVTAKSLGIDQLAVEDELALVEEPWASICADETEYKRLEVQRAELDRRIANNDAFPDDVVPWDEVKSSIVQRFVKPWQCASDPRTRGSSRSPMPALPIRDLLSSSWRRHY